MNLFKKRKYVSLNIPSSTDSHSSEYSEPVVPDGLWIKCTCCANTIYNKETGKNKLCPKCGGCLRLNSQERIQITADEGSFVPFDAEMSSKNPMSYPGYEDKIKAVQALTSLYDAVVTGKCTIGGKPCVLCVMDSNFIMGSMGSVVGEKITRAFEYATKNEMSIVIFTASGGARMQEGIISLMQMAKVSAAAKRHSEAQLLYITVITDPTTGGVTASFAMLGDIILAEPRALIGFAGRRVIEQTIKQKLPDDFQTSEFLFEHGFIDKIVQREDLRPVLASILHIHCAKHELVVQNNG